MTGAIASAMAVCATCGMPVRVEFHGSTIHRVSAVCGHVQPQQPGGSTVDKQERDARHRPLIEARLASDGLNPDEWKDDEDGNLQAVVGRWRAVDDTEEGLCEGDVGLVHICVLGSPEHGSENVGYHMTPDEQEGSYRVVPFQNIEPEDD